MLKQGRLCRELCPRQTAGNMTAGTRVPAGGRGRLILPKKQNSDLTERESPAGELTQSPHPTFRRGAAGPHSLRSARGPAPAPCGEAGASPSGRAAALSTWQRRRAGGSAASSGRQVTGGPRRAGLHGTAHRGKALGLRGGRRWGREGPGGKGACQLAWVSPPGCFGHHSRNAFPLPRSGCTCGGVRCGFCGGSR